MWLVSTVFSSIVLLCVSSIIVKIVIAILTLLIIIKVIIIMTIKIIILIKITITVIMKTKKVLKLMKIVVQSHNPKTYICSNSANAQQEV